MQERLFSYSSGSKDELSVDDRLAHEMEIVWAAFDVDFYLTHYPDVAKAEGLDPLAHFCRYGWKEERDPSADFSTRHYLQSNPDVTAAGINPLWHYVITGKDEGRQLEPSALSQPVPTTKNSAPDDRLAHEMEIVWAAFDVDFYLTHYPDVAKAEGLDPLAHFCRYGWKEERDPSADFSTRHYLQSNPDVTAAGINPLWHYVITGKDEGRQIGHPGGYKTEILLNAKPLEETVAAWRSQKSPEETLSTQDLITVIRNVAKDMASRLVVSIGHDNYRAVAGGVQFCIYQEEQKAAEKGWLYLNIHPYQPLPRLAHQDEDPDILVALLLAGAQIGVAPMSALIAAVADLAVDPFKIDMIVHHLLGYNPEQISDLVLATGHNNCWMWLHDFFTICPSPGLQRNSVSPCDAPSMHSNACTLCLYGAERRLQADRIAAFFDILDVHVLVPSRFAGDFWSRKSDFAPVDMTVIEHMIVSEEKRDRKTRQADSPQITVAYIGYPGPYKGWPVFERLVRALSGQSADFRFLYFGVSPIALSGVETVPVQVTAQDPDAMIRALDEHGVDILLHWATCGETFSFSTHEALAAGACVLTNAISGNVAATVRTLDLGVVLDNEADLETFFRDGRVDQMVADLREKRRVSLPVLTRSDMTISMLEQELST